MRNPILIAVMLIAGSILAATIAVLKYSISPLAGSLSVVIVASFVGYFNLWLTDKHDISELTAKPRKQRAALGVLLSTITMGAIYGLIANLQSDSWNVGDTIGVTFVGIMISLILYSILSRK
jgi:hypothetical protein